MCWGSRVRSDCTNIFIKLIGTYAVNGETSYLPLGNEAINLFFFFLNVKQRNVVLFHLLLYTNFKTVMLLLGNRFVNQLW